MRLSWEENQTSQDIHNQHRKTLYVNVQIAPKIEKKWFYQLGGATNSQLLGHR